MQEAASHIVKQEIAQRTGWFRPFCLAILVLLLLNTCAVGGAIVLVVGGIVSIPPGLLSAFTGGQSPISITATTVLERVQSLSQLTTVRHSYSSLITSQRELPPILAGLYGDKLIMVAVGHVNAGIDLSQLTKDSVNRDGTTVTIRLPPPQLQDCFLNEAASYVVSRDTGVFAKPAPNMDLAARRFAVGQFRDMALTKDDIMSEVQSNAQLIIKNVVLTLGAEKVNVITSPADPNMALPDSCK